MVLGAPQIPRLALQNRRAPGRGALDGGLALLGREVGAAGLEDLLGLPELVLDRRGDREEAAPHADVRLGDGLVHAVHALRGKAREESEIPPWCEYKKSTSRGGELGDYGSAGTSRRCSQATDL